MFPTETKAEKPRPRAFACSSSASPSAPLWEEKPMFPGGKAYGAKVAFRLAAELAIPRQFGPIRRAPCVRTSASSRSCRSAPSCPELGEARRDDAERAHAQAERGLGRLEDDLRREADDREVDALGHLLDRGVAGDSRDVPRRSG